MTRSALILVERLEQSTKSEKCLHDRSPSSGVEKDCKAQAGELAATAGRLQ